MSEKLKDSILTTLSQNDRITLFRQPLFCFSYVVRPVGFQDQHDIGKSEENSRFLVHDLEYIQAYSRAR